MITITEYTVETIKDPFGILTGQRYEFMLDIEVPEDDELHSENGLYIRVIYSVDEGRSGIAKYEIYEKTTKRYLDLELEDDELEAVEKFCKDRLSDAKKA